MSERSFSADVMETARQVAHRALVGLPLGKTPEQAEASIDFSADVIAFAIESARAAGYAAGIADAEKAALDYTAREDDYPSAVARDFYQSGVADAVSDIAESIRALSTSEKGEAR